METQILLDNDFATARYFGQQKLVTIVWKSKMPDFMEYQKIYKTCLVFQRTNAVHFTLSDTTKQADYPAEYSKWFVEFVLPIAVRQGVKRMGIITSGNVLKLQYINNAFKTSKQYGIPFKAFKNEEAAQEWLFSEALV